MKRESKGPVFPSAITDIVGTPEESRWLFFVPLAVLGVGALVPLFWIGGRLAKRRLTR